MIQQHQLNNKSKYFYTYVPIKLFKNFNFKSFKNFNFKGFKNFNKLIIIFEEIKGPVEVF